VATVVFLHAHPDDETVLTGGTIAALADAGHRVVLVVATGGELGEAPEDLAPDEGLAARRTVELGRSAAVLGIARVVQLGYHDSGMDGWVENAAAHAFGQAPVAEAAARVAQVLREESADVLVGYDANGNYGHPDHVQVHHVAHAAAALAGTPVLYEATANRDVARQGFEDAVAAGMEMPGQDDRATGEVPVVEIGMPEAVLTTRVDVLPWLGRKRDAVRSHASQVSDTSFFLAFPDDVFASAFGAEWFIRVGAPPGVHEHTLAGLDLGPVRPGAPAEP
jgi:LmbE family N-acetylglucosaminyl deacetylase